VTLAGIKDNRVVVQATANLDAYQLYVKGGALVHRRGRASRLGSTCFGRRSNSAPLFTEQYTVSAELMRVLMNTLRIAAAIMLAIDIDSAASATVIGKSQMS
jgi:hypothetical protein